MFEKLKQLFKNIKWLCNIDVEDRFIKLNSYINSQRIVNTQNICNLKDMIDENFNINLDIHTRGGSVSSQVIVAGNFKGRDLIKVYTIHARDFQDLVNTLNEREKFGEVKRVDIHSKFLEKEIKSHFNHTKNGWIL
uniref:hypothetical protein n=1 Tax=Aliarcobacter sp. TaxID=2321116 RepID=UPI004048839B